jgi:antitoxin ParD1/3/4
MVDLTISVPDSVNQFVQEQAARSGFHSVGEYILDLIHQAQVEEATRAVEAKLLEGLNSPLSRMTQQDWAELRRRVQQGSGESTTS